LFLIDQTMYHWFSKITRMSIDRWAHWFSNTIN